MLFLLIVFVNFFITAMKGEPKYCYCVPPEKCPDANITDSHNFQIDIRLDNGECENYLDVCCPVTNFKTDPVTGAVGAPSVQDTFSSYAKSSCGYQSNAGLNSRITGQTYEAHFGEIPWMVVILYAEDSKLVYKCGGSLIHPQVVLTAAHCVENKYAQWIVRAGERDTRNDEPVPFQKRLVNTISVHPHFNPRSLKNDIALLMLDAPLELKENVGTVCLPEQNDVPEKGDCLASGWGKNAYKKGEYSSVLKVVQLPIVSRDACQEALRQTRLGFYYQLHKSFICAGGESNKDTCKGDGGSPLVCLVQNNPVRYLQVGIVSWGIGCGEAGTPGVYTNVALYRHWIDEELANYRLDYTSYAIF